MMNKQPSEARVEADTLDVIRVFPTIQGEGPFAGRPAVFVRLAGCNLQCPQCDTDYTSGRQRVTLEELVEVVAVANMSINTSLVVITGGEPLRQWAALKSFITTLQYTGRVVQIETNGVYIDEEYIEYTKGHRVYTVVSPKTVKLPDGWCDVDNLSCKYVLEAGYVDEHDGLPTRVLGYDRRPARPAIYFTGEVYVQPLDSHDQFADRHLAAAVKSSMKFGHRLSIQGHKLARLP